MCSRARSLFLPPSLRLLLPRALSFSQMKGSLPRTPILWQPCPSPPVALKKHRKQAGAAPGAARASAAAAAAAEIAYNCDIATPNRQLLLYPLSSCSALDSCVCAWVYIHGRARRTKEREWMREEEGGRGGEGWWPHCRLEERGREGG